MFLRMRLVQSKGHKSAGRVRPRNRHEEVRERVELGRWGRG